MGMGLASHTAASLDDLASADLHLGSCGKAAYKQYFEGPMPPAPALIPLGARRAVGIRARAALWTAFIEPSEEGPQSLADKVQAFDDRQDDYSNTGDGQLQAQLDEEGKEAEVATKQAIKANAYHEPGDAVGTVDADGGYMSLTGGAARSGSSVHAASGSPVDAAAYGARVDAGTAGATRGDRVAADAAIATAGPPGSQARADAAEAAAEEKVHEAMKAPANTGVKPVYENGYMDNARNEEVQPVMAAPQVKQEPPELKNLRKDLAAAHGRVEALEQSSKDLHKQENAIFGKPPEDAHDADKPQEKDLDPDPSHTNPFAAAERVIDGGRKQGQLSRSSGDAAPASSASPAPLPAGPATPAAVPGKITDSASSASTAPAAGTNAPVAEEPQTDEIVPPPQDPHNAARGAHETAESAAATTQTGKGDTAKDPTMQDTSEATKATGAASKDSSNEAGENSKETSDSTTNTAPAAGSSSEAAKDTDKAASDSTEAAKGAKEATKDSSKEAGEDLKEASDSTKVTLASSSSKAAKDTDKAANESTGAASSSDAAAQDTSAVAKGAEADKQMQTATKVASLSSTDAKAAADVAGSTPKNAPTREQRIAANDVRRQEQAIMDQERQAMQDQLRILDQMQKIKKESPGKLGAVSKPGKQ